MIYPSTDYLDLCEPFAYILQALRRSDKIQEDDSFLQYALI